MFCYLKFSLDYKSYCNWVSLPLIRITPVCPLSPIETPFIEADVMAKSLPLKTVIKYLELNTSN
jgi:hypothetical protein